MNGSSIQERFDFASNLIQQAGELALSYFRRFDTLVVHSKGQQDMASEADLNTELLIRDRINARFPQDAFLGEETGCTEFSSDQGIWHCRSGLLAAGATGGISAGLFPAAPSWGDVPSRRFGCIDALLCRVRASDRIC
jgi:3'-phosphoadenosine 5'-phosphosulfate (PAPS) 3'-phosphatase